MGKSSNKVLIFSMMLIFFEVFYWCIMFFNRAELMDCYFITDYADTSMDYFNMLSNLRYDTPYIFHANYPAMCFFILDIFFHFIPLNFRGKDGFFYRNYMPAQLVYIIYSLFLIIVLWEILKKCIDGDNFVKYIFSIAIIISGPIIFLLERGNFLFIALVSSLIFVNLYNSDNKKLRYISYVALAFAASIKIYPALLGILIFSKKRYKEAIIAIVLGIILFVLPFFHFDGILSIKQMIDGILYASELQGNAGMGINFSFVNLVRIICAFIGIEATEIPAIVKIFPLFICMIVYLVSSREWERVFSLVLLCVWFPEFNYTYILTYFLLPLISFLNEKDDGNPLFHKIFLVMFGLIFIPYALPVLEGMDIPDAKYPLAWGTVIVNMAICIIAMGIVCKRIYNLVIEYKTKRN